MTHPHGAGWKDNTVSRDNAETMDRLGITANTDRQMFTLFNDGFVGTATEASDELRINLLTGRPSVSRLFKRGILKRTDRYVDRHGKSHWVMAFNPQHEDEQGDLFNG